MELFLAIGLIVVIALIVIGLRQSSQTASMPPESRRVGGNGVGARKNDDIVSITDPLENDASISRRFRTVFSMTSESGRSNLIAYYMQKHGCNAQKAMKLAIEDRQRDEERFR
jgi:hypothetical protein